MWVIYCIAWTGQFDKVEHSLGVSSAENSRSPTNRKPDTISVNCQHEQIVTENKPNHFGLTFTGNSTINRETFSIETSRNRSAPSSAHIPDEFLWNFWTNYANIEWIKKNIYKFCLFHAFSLPPSSYNISVHEKTWTSICSCDARTINQTNRYVLFIHRQNRTEQIHYQFTIYNIIDRLRLAEIYRNEWRTKNKSKPKQKFGTNRENKKNQMSARTVNEILKYRFSSNIILKSIWR